MDKRPHTRHASHRYLFSLPNHGNGRLVNAIKAKHMDGDHIQWTESFLSKRTVGMILDGNAMEKHPVEAGVLQGSLVSPIV